MLGVERLTGCVAYPASKFTKNHDAKSPLLVIVNIAAISTLQLILMSGISPIQKCIECINLKN